MLSVRQRAEAIRKATPAGILANLFEMQNRLCDLCGHPIQDLMLAALDHSTPVIRYARAIDIAIEDAVRECNDPSNLRCAHASCNHIKHIMTRAEWYASGRHILPMPKLFTVGELANMREALRIARSRAGQIGGRATNATTNGRKRHGGQIACRSGLNADVQFVAQRIQKMIDARRGHVGGGRSGLNADPEYLSRRGRAGARVGVCKRCRINRGLPCICGRHPTTHSDS